MQKVKNKISTSALKTGGCGCGKGMTFGATTKTRTNIIRETPKKNIPIKIL